MADGTDPVSLEEQRRQAADRLFAQEMADEDQRKAFRQQSWDMTQPPPDQAGEALQLGNKFGVPRKAVEADPDYWKRRDQEARRKLLMEASPRTMAWLDDEDNYAVAKDDVDILSQIESTFSKIGYAAKGGFQRFAAVGVAGERQAMGETMEFYRQRDEWEARQERRKKLGQDAPRGWRTVRVPDVGTISGFDVPISYGNLDTAPVASGIVREEVRKALPESMRPMFASQVGIDDAKAVRGVLERRMATVDARARAKVEEFTETLEKAQTGNYVADGLLSGVTSLTEMAPSMAAFFALRGRGGATVASGAMGVQVAGAEYLEGIYNLNLSERDASDRALLQAGVEIVTERISLGYLDELLKSDRGFVSKLALSMGQEQIQEQFATLGNRLVDIPYVDQDMTIGRFVEETPYYAGQTALATLVASGITNTTLIGLDTAVRDMVERSLLSQPSAGDAAIDAVLKKAKESRLGKRSPEKLKDVLDRQAAGTGVETVTVDLDELAQTLKAKGVELSDALDGLGVPRDELQQKWENFGEIEVKLSDLATSDLMRLHGAETQANTRRNDDPYTPARKEKMRAALDPEMRETAKRIYDDLQNGADMAEKEQQVADRVRQRIRGAGILAEREQENASVAIQTAMVTTLARRVGADPLEFFDQHYPRIQGSIDGMVAEEGALESSASPSNKEARLAFFEAMPEVLESARRHSEKIRGNADSVDADLSNPGFLERQYLEDLNRKKNELNEKAQDANQAGDAVAYEAFADQADEVRQQIKAEEARQKQAVKRAMEEGALESGATSIVARGEYSRGLGAFSVEIVPEQRADGSYVLTRKITDESGERQEYFSKDGSWQSGRPSTVVFGANIGQITEGPEVFPDISSALQMGRDAGLPEGASIVSGNVAAGDLLAQEITMPDLDNKDEVEAALNDPETDVLPLTEGMQILELDEFIAFHGTTAKFDQFKSDKIGAGEGAQAFGPGHYFTQSAGVANWYRKRMKKLSPGIKLGKESFNKANPAHFALAEYWKYRDKFLHHDLFGGYRSLASDMTHSGALERAIFSLQYEIDQIESPFLYPGRAASEYAAADRPVIRDRKELAAFLKQGLSYLKTLDPKSSKGIPKPRKPTIRGGGNIYTVAVKLPAEATIQYDKPFGQQPAAVQKAFREAAEAGTLGEVADLIAKYGAATRMGPLVAALKKSDTPAMEIMRRNGVRGVRYLDGMSRGKRNPANQTFNYVVFNDGDVKVLDRKGLLFQELDQQRRGQFSPSRNIITMFEAADVTTLMHEGAHWYLAEIERMAMAENAHPFVTEQWEAVKKWGKVGPDFRMYDDMGRVTPEGRELQEAFAETFEVYLQTGKAPVPSLREAFRAFKQWITALWRDIRTGKIRLPERANLSPEITRVMDRMLAVDEEIESQTAEVVTKAEAMANDLYDRGIITKRQRDAAIMNLEQAREAAKEDLMAQIMQAEMRVREAQLSAEQRRIKGDVTREYDRSAVGRAVSWLGYGTWKGDVPVSETEGLDSEVEFYQSIRTATRMPMEDIYAWVVNNVDSKIQQFSSGDEGTMMSWRLSDAPDAPRVLLSIRLSRKGRADVNLFLNNKMADALDEISDPVERSRIATEMFSQAIMVMRQYSAETPDLKAFNFIAAENEKAGRKAKSREELYRFMLSTMRMDGYTAYEIGSQTSVVRQADGVKSADPLFDGAGFVMIRDGVDVDEFARNEILRGSQSGGDAGEVVTALTAVRLSRPARGGMDRGRLEAGRADPGGAVDDTLGQSPLTPENYKPVEEIASVDDSFAFARSQPFATNRELKVEMQRRVESAAEDNNADLSDEDYLVRMTERDARSALIGNANAVGWYDEKVRKSITALTLLHPELETDAEARFAFTWALAVTSNGLKVDKNFELAETVYSAWKASSADGASRRMPTNVGIGQAAGAINKSLGLYNTLVEKHGVQVVLEFMTARQTVKQVQDFTGENVSGENLTTEVFGAAALGPKIGNGFFMNLYGEFGQLTMDRWLMRTWGRWNATLITDYSRQARESRKKLGALLKLLSNEDKRALEKIIRRPIKLREIDEVGLAIQRASQKPALREKMNELGWFGNDEPSEITDILGPFPKGKPRKSVGAEVRKRGNALAKYLDGQKEQPSGPPERAKIRAVFARALDNLKNDFPTLTMADLQALLWYPEKRLYDTAKAKEGEETEGYEDDEAPDYANAARNLVVSKGVSEASVRDAYARIDADVQAARRAGRVERGGQGRSGDGSLGTQDGALQDDTLGQEAAPTFYSALGRFIASSNTARAPAAQWKGMISNAPGVKAEEVEWTGVMDWLDASEGPVTREALAAFVEANGVRVEEVSKGGAGAAPAFQIDGEFNVPAIRDAIGRALRDGATDYGDLQMNLENDGDFYRYMERSYPEYFEEDEADSGRLAERVLEDAEVNFGAATKFESYVLPGGTGYTELLLTIPKVRGPETHWDEDSVVAHTRFKERTGPNGERVLALEEIQSDWHQQGREDGYEQTVDPQVAEDARAAFEKARIERNAADKAILDFIAEMEKPDLRTLFEAIYWGSSRDSAFFDDLVESVYATADFRNLTEQQQQLIRRRGLQELRMNYTGFSKEARAQISELGANFDAAQLRFTEADTAYMNAAYPGGVPNAPFKNNAWANLVLKRMIRYAAENGFDAVAWIPGNVQNGQIVEDTGDNRGDFYDKIVPNLASKLGKKYGAKVGRMPLDAATRDEGNRRLGYEVVDENGDQYDSFDTIQAAQQAAEDAGPGYAVRGLGAPPVMFHSLPITPELAAAAMTEGFPLFQRGDPKGWGETAPPPDLPPMRLDLEAVRELYGEDAVRRLPKPIRDRSRDKTSIDGMMDIIRANVKTLKRKPPMTLFQYIRSRKARTVAGQTVPIKKWGIKGAADELKAMNREDLINETNGIHIDYVRESAAEAGYLPEDATLNDFLNAIDREARGEPVYSRFDQKEVEDQRFAKEWADWLDSQGVDMFEANQKKLKAEIAKIVTSTAADARTPDEIAAKLGFADGETMLNMLALMGNRDQWVKEETDRRMREEFGDPMADGTFEEEARVIAEAEVMSRAAEIEMEALARAVGEPAASKLAKEMAMDSLGLMTVKELEGWERFLNAERREMNNTLEAVKRGDMVQAFIHKRRQLVNMHLARAAREKSIAIEKTRKDLLTYYSSKGRRDKIAPDYLEKIEALLEGYELRASKQGPGEQKRRMSAKEYVDQMIADGREAEIAPEAMMLAEMAGNKVWRGLTADEVDYLAGTVKNLAHLGRTKGRLMREQEKRRFDAVVAELVDTLMAAPSSRPRGKSFSPGAVEEVTTRASQFDAKLTKIQDELELLDGREAGPLQTTLLLPMEQADVRKGTMMRGAIKEIRRLWNDVPAQLRRQTLSRRVATPELKLPTNENMTLMDVVIIGLNWGNAGNRQALIDGYGWDPASVEAVLDRYLTNEHWQFIEGVWSLIGSYKADAFALEKRITGVEPKAVEGITFTLPSGRVVKGQYYPLKYDADQESALSVKQQKLDEKQMLSEMGLSFSKPMTKTGHLISRVGSGGKPVKVSIDVFYEHVENVVHDIAFRPAVIDAFKIIRDPRFTQAYIDAAGKAQYDRLLPWLHSIATNNRARFSSTFARTMTFFRGSWSIAIMGYSFSTATQQLTGYLEAGTEIGGRWVMQGALKSLSMGPASFWREWAFIRDRSEYLSNRVAFGKERDIRAVRTRATIGGPLTPIGDNAFVFLSVMDAIVGTAVWRGAYDKAMAGKVKGITNGEEDAAIAYADRAVQRSLSSGETYALPEIMREGEISALMTMVYSYGSKTYNRQRVRNMKLRQGRIGVAEFTINTLIAFTAVPILAALLAGRLWPDDEEEWEERGDDVGNEILMNAAGTTPFVRDMITLLAKPQYGYQLSPVQSTFEQIGVATRSAAEGKTFDNEYQVKQAVMAISTIFRLPGGQLFETGDYVYDLYMGDEDPLEDPADAAREAFIRSER
jgi:hypothetical protein